MRTNTNHPARDIDFVTLTYLRLLDAKTDGFHSIRMIYNGSCRVENLFGRGVHEKAWFSCPAELNRWLREQVDAMDTTHPCA